MLGAAGEILPSLNAVEPDLSVIVVSDAHDGVEQVLKLLAAAQFRGKVMLHGQQEHARVAAAQRLGEQLGLDDASRPRHSLSHAAS